MIAEHVFENGPEFAECLRQLRKSRRARKDEWKVERKGRRLLTDGERGAVLNKTGGRCHLCGGTIEGDAWSLDHVCPVALGGPDGPENYLAAHALCNAYKWDNSPEDFQWLLKLGVWVRHEIETGSRIGIAAARAFAADDKKRHGRRKPAQK